MNAVINVALPFFALIFTGYFAGRRLPSGATTGLTHFVFFFALPALLVVKVAEAPVAALLEPRLFVAYYGAGLLLYALTYVLGRWLFPARPAIYALRALAATFSNVGFIGLPLVILAFGAEATPPAVVVLVVDTVVMIGLTVAIIEADLGGGNHFLAVMASVLRGLMRNPLIIASFIGAALAFAGVSIPEPLKVYGNLLGDAAAPCALFALGATLSLQPLSRLKQGAQQAGFLSVMKLIVHPLLVWMACVLLGLKPLWTAVLVIEAALPVAANVYLLSQRYGTYSDESSSAVLISTTFALISVSLVLAHYLSAL